MTWQRVCYVMETTLIKGTEMKHLKKIGSVGIAILAVGLALAVGSAWINREAGEMPDNFAIQATNLSCKLYTLAAIFFVVGGLELQRRKTARHIQDLEMKLEALSHQTFDLSRAPHNIHVLPRVGTEESIANKECANMHLSLVRL
jgi:hypothetical protein